MWAKASNVSATVFSKQFGTVQVYTRRHISGCTLVGRNSNHCPCPKYIDAKSRQGARLRQAAGTPSFTEACEIAQRWHRGLDPEIQAALQRYYATLRGRKLAPGYMGGSITPVFDRRPLLSLNAQHKGLENPTVVS